MAFNIYGVRVAYMLAMGLDRLGKVWKSSRFPFLNEFIKEAQMCTTTSAKTKVFTMLESRINQERLGKIRLTYSTHNIDGLAAAN